MKSTVFPTSRYIIPRDWFDNIMNNNNIILLNNSQFLNKDKTTLNDFIDERNIVLILFQHRNEFTIKECKRFAKSTDKSFHQGLVFNPVEVQMDYYMPVPVYKRLNKHMCELLYFDLAFIDDDKR